MEENTCVYYFFNDKRKREKKLKPLHKLLLKDFYVSNELTNIQKIQSYKNHFYVCENNSELEIKELEEDMVELKSCKNISKDDTVLLKFENREIIYLKNYLKALSSSTKYIFTIIHFYKNLLKSIHLLVENQLVHNNIHFDTIVVDKKHYPLISDFSLSINISSPNIQKYMDEQINNAKELGFVETLMGRRRWLRDINSSNFTVRGFAERNAINSPIQGSAADMIKLAMIKIHGEMKKIKWESKMILQVHDELVFDAVEKELPALKELILKCMKEAMILPNGVPVEAEVGVGKNWLEAH